MRRLLSVLVGIVALVWACPVHSEECGVTAQCVPKEDLKVFVKLLEAKQCQQKQSPTFDVSPIQIVTDSQGRVFYSGDSPHPYTLKMRWCDYEVEAKGKLKVTVAMKTPETWGFRFRPKAYLGLLPTEAVYASDARVRDMVDAGVMLDFLHYKLANLNASVGYRSVGLGLGVDVTTNFGAGLGYGLTWGDWHHSLLATAWFGF